jgi:hypothetical protein
MHSTLSLSLSPLVVRLLLPPSLRLMDPLLLCECARRRASSFNEKEILAGLTLSLQNEMSDHHHRRIINGVPLLQSLDARVRTGLLQLMRPTFHVSIVSPPSLFTSCHTSLPPPPSSLSHSQSLAIPSLSLPSLSLPLPLFLSLSLVHALLLSCARTSSPMFRPLPAALAPHRVRL